MKTTLMITDKLMADIKALAAKRRQTLSATVEALLRAGFRKETSQKKPNPLPPLQRFSAGKCLVDVSDRDALYQVMERK